MNDLDPALAADLTEYLAAARRARELVRRLSQYHHLGTYQQALVECHGNWTHQLESAAANLGRALKQARDLERIAREVLSDAELFAADVYDRGPLH